MNSQDGEATERLRRQQDALARFGSDCLLSRDLDEILNRAAELVAEGLDIRRAKVLELLPDGTTLLMRAGVNWHPGTVGHVRFGADKDSPAGFALAQSEPVVSPDLDEETRFKIPDVLIEHRIKSMVNVIIEGEEGPFGVLEVDATDKRDFDEHETSFLKNYANLLASAVDRHRAHKKLKKALSGQTVLVQELEHRVKNMLALVQSLAKQTTAEDASARAYRDIFLGRLRALTQAENLVFDDHAQVLDLRELAKRSVEPFEAADAPVPKIEGPQVMLQARQGRMMALVLHELGTNATKHGALSVPEGVVELSWNIEEEPEGHRVHLHWREVGGPKVELPGRGGFGTRLLADLAAYELDGEAQLKYLPEGFQYELKFPI
ncbi:sensor histidine kinase [Qipengyuania sp. SM2507]